MNIAAIRRFFMLRFFRFNDPYRLLFILLAVIVLGIKTEVESSKVTLPEFSGVLVGEMMADGKSMYAEVWYSMPPVPAFIHYVLDLVFDRSLLSRHVVALILIFFQAALFGVMLISNRAFNESNYLPSFVFVLLSFFSPDTVNLTGEIIGATLLLLAINNLLKEIEFKRQHDETVHNLGFYLGLASLSVFSHLVFFVGVSILLFIFTRVEVRRFGLYLIGFLLPHLIINLWYYWNNNFDLLWANFYLPNLQFSTQSLITPIGLLILSGIPLAYFFFALIMMRRDAHLTKYQSQIAQVMFFWLLFGLIEVYFNQIRTPQVLVTCIPPLAYFISHYFLLIRRKWLAEATLWLFLTGLIAINSLAVRNRLPMDLSRLYIEGGNNGATGKKVLVMDDDLTPYIRNKTSTFFLDWKLYQVVFNEPNIYQHVLTVANAFEKDPPDLIIDPENRFKGILQFIPQIREKYRREGNFYVRIP